MNDKNIRKHWFKDNQVSKHEVSREQGWEYLRFNKPGSTFYLVAYRLHGHTLTVTGDVGDAIYQWYGEPEPTLKWISRLSLDYFASKCVASENGRGYKEWNSDRAEIRLKEHLAEVYEDGAKAKEEAIRKAGGYEALQSKQCWQYWLIDQGDEVIGDEAYDLGEIGEDVSIRCRGHLVGLKMAFEQIEAEEKEPSIEDVRVFMNVVTKSLGDLNKLLRFDMVNTEEVGEIIANVFDEYSVPVEIDTEMSTEHSVVCNVKAPVIFSIDQVVIKKPDGVSSDEWDEIVTEIEDIVREMHEEAGIGD